MHHQDVGRDSMGDPVQDFVPGLPATGGGNHCEIKKTTHRHNPIEKLSRNRNSMANFVFQALHNSLSFAFKHVPPPLFTDPNEIAQYLPVKETVCEKLEFPEDLHPELAAAPESTQEESK